LAARVREFSKKNGRRGAVVFIGERFRGGGERIAMNLYGISTNNIAIGLVRVRKIRFRPT
jgi:hypothetical protein